jgi:hypothetical protein
MGIRSQIVGRGVKRVVRQFDREDAQLLAAARLEPEAFAVFYDRYEPIVVGYLVRRVRDPEVRTFSYYNKRVEIHDSARKHGVADQDIVHAIDHALAIADAGEDPDRWLLIGPDTAGNLLEVLVVITAEGPQIAIHAMPMRDKYAKLLEP